MKSLLDTNVIRELARRRPEPRVVRWVSACTHIAVSAITVEEVFFGLALKSNPRVQDVVERFIDEQCVVHEVTTEIARHAGVLRAQLRLRGTTRTQADMLIAASAAVHGLALATRNVRDFADCGVLVVDPFR